MDEMTVDTEIRIAGWNADRESERLVAYDVLLGWAMLEGLDEFYSSDGWPWTQQELRDEMKELAMRVSHFRRIGQIDTTQPLHNKRALLMVLHNGLRQAIINARRN